MKTAKRILSNLSDFRGVAHLFELSEPVEHRDDEVTKYVIVSEVDAFDTGPETYIFPATADGQILNWGELEGSFKGSMDFNKALENAGFQIVTE